MKKLSQFSALLLAVMMPLSLAACGGGGFTDIKTEKTTVTFAGTEHDGITITANVQSTAVHEVLACVKVGNYVAVITAVTFGDSNPSEILDLFKAI